MKTFVPLKKIFNYLSLLIVYILCSVSVKAQTYTTIANGNWNSAATWQGGAIPNATNIPASAVINIRHSINYSGSDINNFGTINIYNAAGVTPRLFVPGAVNLNNMSTGKFYITAGEYRQYRFIGGGELGIAQIGNFSNIGGLVSVKNSFVEVAENWSNESNGIIVVRNSSLVLGGSYDIKSSAVDTLMYTSVSVGWHGSGDFTANGTRVYFQYFRAEVASLAGTFKINNGIANGNINYITLKNHLTGLYSLNKIEFTAGVITTGLTLDAYCISILSNYQPNGKVSGTQTPNCTLNCFPAALLTPASSSAFNFTTSPLLVSGTNLQVGATYKYEAVKPGVDAIIKIDSLIAGATVIMFDDNSAGYAEGFQPQVRSGPGVGESYAVFSINYKITGTSVDYRLDTFSVTAIDIDGGSNLREFDQVSLGAGSTASYMAGNPAISITQVVPGTFRATNLDFVDNPGIDTVKKAYMFTVTNTNVSLFTFKVGMVTTQAQQTNRVYSIYMKGFNYPGQSTLPVKLASFTATLNKNNNHADLKWTTASEINASHFRIERSTDGVNFNEAGIVFANGNATDNTNYSFSDNLATIQSGIVYYRLVSVDADGKGQYSETRIIRISKQMETAISSVAFPNPVINEVRISIPNEWQNKKVTYEVVNANGQVSKKTETGSSSQTETVNMSTLSRGFYVIRVSCEGQTAQQKIIKQ